MSTPTTRLFNGSILHFAGSPVAQIAGIAYNAAGNWVEVTQPADLNKIWEMGFPDYSLRVKFRGHCTLTRRSKGAVSITWADGTSDSLPGTWQVGPGTEGEGDLDTPITGSAELRPTVPEAS